MPFADPPRRFKPPTPKEPWDEPLRVTEFKEACMQFEVLPLGPAGISEDCLYLNVFSPSPKVTQCQIMLSLIVQLRRHWSASFHFKFSVLTFDPHVLFKTVHKPYPIT